MNEQDPWALDKLGRKDAAAFLEEYLVRRYELRRRLQASSAEPEKLLEPNTFVLNVQAPWGFGKTFFLTGLASELKAKGHPVAFYDAWANDFTDDPIVGFIAEISQNLVSKTVAMAPAEKMLDEAIAVGKKMIKPVWKVVAGALAKHLAGLSLDDLKKLFDDGDIGQVKADEFDVGGLLSKVGDVALKQHLNQKEQIALFHQKMARFVSALEAQKGVRLPVFIIVDELDRCRPSYAIELLEAIKHLFGVPGIYFVVATNLSQLGHSIAAVYGEKFDAERYLKRFFDQEYVLPNPPRDNFISFLIAKYPALAEADNVCVPRFAEHYGEIISPQHLAFSLVTDAFRLGLRDQMQVAAMTDAVLLAWPKGEQIHLLLLMFLVSLRQVSTESFEKLDVGGQVTDALRGVTEYNDANLGLVAPRERGDVFGRPRVRFYSLAEVVQTYLHGGKLDIRALSEKASSEGLALVYGDLMRDVPNSYPLNAPPPTPKVHSYFGRVRHAGQLN
ncbi:MAG TPA: P-loop NTPase fold protein [Pseudoduganella sp.]